MEFDIINQSIDQFERRAKMQTVGAFEAKTNLSELLSKVEHGETFMITRRGTPVAVLSSPVESAVSADVECIASSILEMRNKFAREGVFNGLNFRDLAGEGRM